LSFRYASCLFHCDLHPPHRHSFPTRRSSDLALWCDRTDHSSCSSRPISSSRFTSSELSPMCCLVNVDHRPSCTNESTISALPMRDRKSTRLNSSHGSISYAVFCLTTKMSVFL